MAKVNTEKPAGREEGKRIAKAPKKNTQNFENAPTKEAKKEENKPEEKSGTENKTKEKPEEKKPEIKKVKKSETSVNIENLGVSTKVASSICKFIMNKKIETALKELEEVTKLKRAIPMKGEYAHRKGKMMSGKYPVRVAKEFVVLLKSLQGNASNHDIDSPIITEAFVNKGSTIYASGGRTKKRTHIRIVASAKEVKN
ncbi:MAG: uL22 family ribosomal protein [archaeon]|nr:uL22 family ribosomal protein [archaeon]